MFRFRVEQPSWGICGGAPSTTHHPMPLAHEGRGGFNHPCNPVRGLPLCTQHAQSPLSPCGRGAWGDGRDAPPLLLWTHTPVKRTLDTYRVPGRVPGASPIYFLMPGKAITKLFHHHPRLITVYFAIIGVVADGGDAVAAWGKLAARYVVAKHGVGERLLADEGGRD